MITAICQKKCTFQGRLWQVGQEYRGDAEPPRYFEIKGKDEEKQEEVQEKKQKAVQEKKQKEVQEVEQGE
jgi:hypothetical protein